MKLWIFSILTALFIASAAEAKTTGNIENTSLSLCILNNLRGPSPIQIASEVKALETATQLLRAEAERPLTPSEVKEVRRIERIKRKDKSDTTIGNDQVREFYKGKLKNTAKILDAEVQYRRAQQSAFDLDVAAISQVAANRLKELGVDIQTPVKADFIHLSDVIDGLRAGHGPEQSYNNEEIAQYLVYEAASSDFREATRHQKDPEWKERTERLGPLTEALFTQLPTTLRRNPGIIGNRILQGCCHLGCGRCFYGAVKDVQPSFNPASAQRTELPLYKALELVRPFIPTIDSANPVWIAGKNKNLR